MYSNTDMNRYMYFSVLTKDVLVLVVVFPAETTTVDDKTKRIMTVE